MSLISDALKEAQKKRGERRETLPPHPSLPSPEKKKKRQKPFLGLTIFAIILVAFSVYFYLQMDKILKVRNRVIATPSYTSAEIGHQEILMGESKKEEKESQKPSENITQQSLPAVDQEREAVEKKSRSPSLNPLIPLPPPKIEERRTVPEKTQKKEIPEIEEGEKQKQIEIIRSLISTKKSQEEEELLEIEKAESNGEWSKACALWEKIIEKNEKKEYFLNAGLAYKNAGNLRRAEELFLKALEIDPDYLPSLNNLGVLYLEKGDYDKANEYLEMALRISPSDAEIYVNLGISLFKKNDFPRAKGYFEEALKLNNKLYQPYYYLGIIYLNQKDKGRALFNFQRLVELAPQDFPSELKNWVKAKIEQLKLQKP